MLLSRLSIIKINVTEVLDSALNCSSQSFVTMTSPLHGNGDVVVTKEVRRSDTQLDYYKFTEKLQN